MDKASLARDHRSRFTDPDFLAEVSELTGISYRVLQAAFAGERRELALDVVKAVVVENLDTGPETWTEILKERAKAEGLGEHRPGYWEGYDFTYEHNDYLRSIGRL